MRVRLTLVIGPQGGVNFSNTSTMVRCVFDDFSSNKFIYQECHLYDFGIGVELAFKCNGCDRYYPTITSSVDHVIPRTRIQYKIREGSGHYITVIGHTITFPRIGEITLIRTDTGNIEYDFYETTDDGHLYLRDFNESVDIDDVLKNYIGNLALMCPYCNSQKGNRR